MLSIYNNFLQMADVHSKEIRSLNMSRIKAKDTKPELIVRRYLHSQGIRFRLHDKNLPGKPDVVLKKYNVVVFINGCFWHGHKNCKYFKIPSTRTDWWKSKIKKNSENDITKQSLIEEQGWKIIVIWSCELKPDKIADTLICLLTKIVKNQPRNT